MYKPADGVIIETQCVVNKFRHSNTQLCKVLGAKSTGEITISVPTEALMVSITIEDIEELLKQIQLKSLINNGGKENECK